MGEVRKRKFYEPRFVAQNRGFGSLGGAFLMQAPSPFRPVLRLPPVTRLPPHPNETVGVMLTRQPKLPLLEIGVRFLTHPSSCSGAATQVATTTCTAHKHCSPTASRLQAPEAGQMNSSRGVPAVFQRRRQVLGRLHPNYSSCCPLCRRLL